MNTASTGAELGEIDLRNPPATPLLQVNGLTVSFPTRDGVVHAVNDVSFTLKRGSILGIVGESGSGKSVTSRSIMRTLRYPGRIDAGEILFDGEDILGYSPHRMRQLRGAKIAMVFQDPQATLNPVMKIGDQIVEALRVHGVGSEEARERTLDLLRQVGIPDVERTVGLYPHEFSGGMRQRVVIAIALANQPDLLLADEPTTALDVTIQAQILELLADLRERLGISIIMITHDMGVVAELCDEMLVMYAGRIVEHGSVSDVMQRPRHPYTAALLKAVPRLDQDGKAVLPSIPGAPPNMWMVPGGCAFHPRCPVAVEKCRTLRPALVEVESGRESACWVSQEGGDVSSLPTPNVGRQRRRDLSDEPILKVERLRTDVGSARHSLFGKRRPVYAVDDVSLEVHPGETLGLVGESGCGKSTLARTIVGINRASSGRIIAKGVDATNSARSLVSSIQYVFQDPFASLNPRRTVGQSLDEALGIAGVTGGDARKRAGELTELVGLDRVHLGRYPSALSGGQRQRVGIARALAARPELIICDEPVSALDVSIQAQIINLLEDLRDELGLAYLFIAHDLSVVRHLSDRVSVMYLGRIVEEGDSDAVYSQPQHPYTAALLSSSPEPTAGAGRERIVLRGDLPSPASPPSGCRFRTRCPIGPLTHPERRICAEVVPELHETQTGQRAACHFAGELVAAGVRR